MTLFCGKHHEILDIEVPIDLVRGHFCDLEAIAGAYEELERWERLDEFTLDYLLEPIRVGKLNWQGRYQCRYVFESENVHVWATVKSDRQANIFARGRAEFLATGEYSTRVDWRSTMDCEIPARWPLGRTIKPIVEKSVSDGSARFLKVLKRAL